MLPILAREERALETRLGALSQYSTYVVGANEMEIPAIVALKGSLEPATKQQLSILHSTHLPSASRLTRQEATRPQATFPCSAGFSFCFHPSRLCVAVSLCRCVILCQAISLLCLLPIQQARVLDLTGLYVPTRLTRLSGREQWHHDNRPRSRGGPPHQLSRYLSLAFVVGKHLFHFQSAATGSRPNNDQWLAY